MNTENTPALERHAIVALMDTGLSEEQATELVELAREQGQKLREAREDEQTTGPDDKVEIGYLCRKGHFIFHDDPDVDYACGSKRMAGIFVVPDEGVYADMLEEALMEARADFGAALGRA